ncbi:MAG: efflux transporter outer membrane subunit [Thiobacillaceae bacterium]
MTVNRVGAATAEMPSVAANRLIRMVRAAALAAALAGCAVGPDFKRPVPPQVDRYSADADPLSTASVDGQAQHFASAAKVLPDWWRLFDSPDLDSLVKTGLKNSPTVATAQAILSQSEHNLRAGQGVFYPEVDLGFGFARQQLSPVRQGVSGPPTVFSLYTLSAAVSYALDVFGGERRMVEGLAAQVDVQRATAQATYLTLVGNIINTAIAGAAYRAEADATQRLIALQREQVAIVEAQADAGLVPAANVVAVKSQLAANEAVLPTILQQQTAAEDLLATLLGFVPAEAKFPKLALEDIRLPATLPVSLPSSLVRQRPDILAAEANLHVASAQVGVATAALFPTLTLSANYGLSNPSLGDLNDPNGRFWGVGPGISFPLFQGGSAWAQKKSAEAGYEAALAKYRQTVLSAFAQVADTLQALAHDAQVAAARRQSLELSIEQRDLLAANHEAGIVDDLDWLVARQQVETARIAMTDATAQRYQDSVALFVALGGGWWNAPCQDGIVPKVSCTGVQTGGPVNHDVGTAKQNEEQP